MKEIWESVKGFEGYYEVSNFGRVKRLSKIIIRSNGRKQSFGEKIMKTSFDKYGYKQVTLSSAGIICKRKVHRLVVESFIGIIKQDKQVNHKNMIKHDNRLSNLEVVSQSENMKHMWANSDRQLSGAVLNNNRQVIAMTIVRKSQKQKITSSSFYKLFNSIRLAAKEIGIKPSGIIGSCRGKQKTAGGYLWRYCE